MNRIQTAITTAIACIMLTAVADDPRIFKGDARNAFRDPAAVGRSPFRDDNAMDIHTFGVIQIERTINHTCLYHQNTFGGDDCDGD